MSRAKEIVARKGVTIRIDHATDEVSWLDPETGKRVTIQCKNGTDADREAGYVLLRYENSTIVRV
jgi:hypothetical protein